MKWVVVASRTGAAAVFSSSRPTPDCAGRMPKRTSAERMAHKPACASNLSSSASCAPKALGRDFRRDHERKKFSPRIHATLLAFLTGMVLSVAALAAVDPLPFKDHAQELRFQALTTQLRCVVCQNESLNDSGAPLAADLRRDVFEQMQAGRSDAEIKQWLTARYSDFVLYDPPLRGGTWLLWFGPLLILLGGSAGIFLIVRRRAHAAASTFANARHDSNAEDDW